jgi:hypothetical protein
LTKRRWIIVAVLSGGAALALALAWVALAYLSPLEVTVHNETGAALPALTLRSEATGQRTAVPGLATGESATVRPALGPSEDQLSLVDAQGRTYVLLGYVEGDPGGSVTVTVTAVTAEGLTGSVLDETRYSPSGEWVLEANVE